MPLPFAPLLLRFLPHIAAALVVAGLLVAVKVQTSRLEDMRQERDTARQNVASLTAAVKGKDGTISALEAAVGQWRALSTPSADALASVAKLETAAAKLAARAASIAPRVEAEKHEPDCAAILALDLGKYCPAHVGRMRQ